MNVVFGVFNIRYLLLSFEWNLCENTRSVAWNAAAMCVCVRVITIDQPNMFEQMLSKANEYVHTKNII